MIETRLRLDIDYLKMANDEEDLQRALDLLAQKGFDRELKEEQKSAIWLNFRIPVHLFASL